MERILDYSRYDYLIYFDIDEDGETYLVGSSNRSIAVNYLLNVNDFTDTTKSPIFKQSTFIECFDLLSKEKDRLLQNEKARLESIRSTFRMIKESLLREHGISFETTQILFVMPLLGWTEKQDKDKLRDFFLNVGWITSKDNESKLVMIPFVQVLAKYFQDEQEICLERERTSVLFSMQQIPWEDRFEFSYTVFKMQSAKELIAVSKTLACSDFLLVPSIVSTESISLTSLVNVMYKAVKRIIARVQRRDPVCVFGKTTPKEDDPAWKVAWAVPRVQEDMLKFGGQNLDDYTFGVNFEQHHLQDFKKWTYGQLIAAIYEDVDVNDYFKQVVNLFKKALSGEGTIRDSPDGIQHILLYSRDIVLLNDSYCIQNALLEANIIQSGSEFLSFTLNRNAEFAMQQSYKMIQIANAMLPPVIIGNEEQNDCSRLQTCKPLNNLIAPNSFYVQANVTETQISFILNKVIEVPSSETGIDLFTVQERSVEIEDVAEASSYLLWNHYQSILDIDEQQHELFERCEDHDTMMLSSSQYEKFSKNARKLINSWFATEDTFTEEELDTYKLVS
ncbi:hypothetical protein MBANPS3_005517, partial [Mucor bainieri]